MMPTTAAMTGEGEKRPRNLLLTGTVQTLARAEALQRVDRMQHTLDTTRGILEARSMVTFRRLAAAAPVLLAVALFEGSPRAQIAPAPPTAAAPRRTAPRLTTPMAEWGHNIGDDY